MCFLVMFEELQEDLDNQLGLLPMGVINLVAFAMLLLVDQLIAPYPSDGLYQLLLASYPAGALFHQYGSKANSPVLVCKSGHTDQTHHI